MKKIALFCILAAVLLIGCAKEETAEEETSAVEEQETVETTEPEETGQEMPPESVEAVTELELVTGARCTDNRIEVTLTNPTDETLTLGKDAKIMINGLISSNPECDKLEIAPEESVYCSDITGPLAIRQGKINRIQINMKSERGVADIDCS